MRDVALRRRAWELDLVKTAAIAGVVLIHVSAGGFAAPAGSFNWLSALFWGSVSRAGVPLFLMCSGALLLDPGRELPLKRLYGHNLLRLLAALLFWATAYKLFRLYTAGWLTGASLYQGVKEVLLFLHEPHLYYLHIMLLVYICLPVTRVFVRHADRRQMEYALAVWFALGILYPTLQPFWPFTLLSGIPVQWMLNMTWAAIGYGVLGWYLRRRPPDRRWGAGLCLTGFALTFFGTWAGTLRRGTLYTHFLEGMTVGVCLLAAGVYALCCGSRHAPGARTAGLLAFWSRASFCVFLVHVFFLELFRANGWMLGELPALLSIPLVALALLGCSGAVYAVLSRIPGVRRWLI